MVSKLGAGLSKQVGRGNSLSQQMSQAVLWLPSKASFSSIKENHFYLCRKPYSTGRCRSLRGSHTRHRGPGPPPHPLLARQGRRMEIYPQGSRTLDSKSAARCGTSLSLTKAARGCWQRAVSPGRSYDRTNVISITNSENTSGFQKAASTRPQ